MAATAKGVRKMKLDYNVDRTTYDAFIKICVRKGYTPSTVVEGLMKKYIETGKI
ncbi:MAG: hypothetical protein GQ477_04010 [Nanohaloarchaea archaeon]|nr:hypothetical protein [Candidatus Nanohaloarchaea archaeon]